MLNENEPKWEPKWGDELCWNYGEFDNSKNKCYSYRNDKENDKMSIVGFVRCKNGVLAFSDSKSTQDYKPQKGREQIDKIYWGKDVVIANYGQNEINGIPFEQLIPNLLNENKVRDYLDFIEVFTSYVKNKLNGQATFQGYFLIYDKNDNCIYEIKNKENCMGLRKSTEYVQKYSCVIGGNEYYANCLNELFDTKYNPEEYDCDFIANLIKTELEKIVKILDQVEYNNPCGLPIVVKKV